MTDSDSRNFSYVSQVLDHTDSSPLNCYHFCNRATVRTNVTSTQPSKFCPRLVKQRLLEVFVRSLQQVFYMTEQQIPPPCKPMDRNQGARIKFSPDISPPVPLPIPHSPPSLSYQDICWLAKSFLFQCRSLAFFV